MLDPIYYKWVGTRTTTDQILIATVENIDYGIIKYQGKEQIKVVQIKKPTSLRYI